MARQRRITILGSGNVATHIAGGLQAAGCHITEVCSRSLTNASRLAESLHDCRPLDNPSDLATDSDLYIIACSDSAIADIAARMPRVDGIVVHTSGSVPLTALAPASSRYGVLYPLQTFSRESHVDLRKVPFFTEASDQATLQETDSYASMLSDLVYHADSRQRTILHIAGVLSCNFVNYLWQLTEETLAPEGYSLDVVRPLIEATLQKAMDIGPYKAQTGPAVRGDLATIQRHTDILPQDTAEIYRILSESIIQSHRK
ncbi:MAG: DUF2520 domain-containing protein [Muribaculaceae bacterium]|nr:DUF2520 domain-containing protein [Muribaculaceae bacterium]MDE6131651.1 DUF2520 domain-containing protein [Muribaculaceae bacterium]